MKTFYKYLLFSIFSLLSVSVMAQSKVETTQKASSFTANTSSNLSTEPRVATDKVYTEEEVMAMAEAKTKIAIERAKARSNKSEKGTLLNKTEASNEKAEQSNYKTKERAGYKISN